MNKWLLVGVVVSACLYFYLTSEHYNLKCVIARKDGNTYCVRDNKMTRERVELLAEATARMKELIAHLERALPNDERVKRLVKNFNPTRIVETLPTSEHTAYSEDKGKKLAFCLDLHKGKAALIDINTLMFVALHELSHLMTVSIGHEQDFWRNFKFMLKHANMIGIYEPVDYSKKPQPYCGMQLTDNPLLDYQNKT